MKFYMADTDRLLRGALIGCGYFGQIQMEAWRRIAGVEIVAACDVDLTKAKATAPRAYDDVEQMLQTEELDFLDIATRPDTHKQLVLAALELKVPVICQKPMAPDLDDAIEMTVAAEISTDLRTLADPWRV